MQIYFDNAATSHPKPKCVIDAVNHALTDINANAGRSGHARAVSAGRVILEAREALAALLGAHDPFSIVFAFNCTDALNLAIKGVIRRGDHVITSMLEHNSVLRVLMELTRRGEIELTLIKPEQDGFVSVAAIRNAARKNTRMICLTHASNLTGAIQPVAAVGALANELGAVYLIDGAQALGAMPVDVSALKCSLYAFPGHKALLAPQGTGGLYIKPGTQLTPIREGGTGTSSESMLQPMELPERYESGTNNLHGIAGLNAGVKYVTANKSQIFMRERELTTALYTGLTQMDGVTVYSPKEEAGRASIVSFNLGDISSTQAADAYDRRNIAVRGGLHCAPAAHRALNTIARGAVRASIGHDNSFDEVERFLQATRDILKRGE